MWRLHAPRFTRGLLVRRRAVVAVAAATAVLLACAVTLTAVSRHNQDHSYRTGTITIVTGGTQGIYYQYGIQLAEAINQRLSGVHADVVSTAASVDNMNRVAAGPNIFAFTAADAASAALAGVAPFDHPVPIRALARIYDDYIHLVVRASTQVHDISDLPGLRVSIGADDSGTQLIALRMLSVAQIPVETMTVSRLGIDESVLALEQGRIDAFFWSGGLPTDGVTNVTEKTGARLVPLSRLEPGMRAPKVGDPAYQAETIPAATYPKAVNPIDIPTVAVPDLIVTRADTDPGLTEAITRILFDARDQIATKVPAANALDRRSAISTFPIPLDEGALRYYRASKV